MTQNESPIHPLKVLGDEEVSLARFICNFLSPFISDTAFTERSYSIAMSSMRKKHYSCMKTTTSHSDSLN